MSLHDYVIDNSDGATVRADINSALAAIVSNNANTTAPTTTTAYMWWADTTAGLLKMRNAADSDWIDKGLLSAVSGEAFLMGAMFVNIGDDGTPATTTETILKSFTLPANTVAVNGQCIEIHIWGSVQDPVTNNAMRVRLGGLTGSVIYQQSTNPSAAHDWGMVFRVYRTSATGQETPASIGIWDGGGGGLGVFNTQTEDWEADMDIVVTGEAGASPAANDIVCKGMKVIFLG